jgi:hypothetical protein
MICLDKPEMPSHSFSRPQINWKKYNCEPGHSQKPRVPFNFADDGRNARNSTKTTGNEFADY